MKRHTIVRMRYFDQSCVRRSALETGHEVPGGLREIAPDLEDRDEFPVPRKRCVERAERVADPAPFLYRRVARVATVDHVPDEAAHNANSAFSRHQSFSLAIESEIAKRLHFERGDGADDPG